MVCVILAAGYATRLYPLTEHFPKPLLEVGGKPILDWLIEDLEESGEIREYVVISNHKFAAQFRTGRRIGRRSGAGTSRWWMMVPRPMRRGLAR